MTLRDQITADLLKHHRNALLLLLMQLCFMLRMKLLQAKCH
jgi:hypothetical protein